MNGRTGMCVLTCLIAWSVPATAQTTVQLPTFHNFSVNTTVSVPTGGGIMLGGISRNFQRSTQRGVPGLGRLPLVGAPLGVRQFAGAQSSGFASVQATVIDLKALEPRLGQNSVLRSSTTGSWTGGALDQEAIARRVAEIRFQQLQE